jgi:hypothetical protein
VPPALQRLAGCSSFIANCTLVAVYPESDISTLVLLFRWTPSSVRKRSDKSSLLLLNAFFQTILCGSQFLIAVVPSVGLLYAPLWEACVCITARAPPYSCISLFLMSVVHSTEIGGVHSSMACLFKGHDCFYVGTSTSAATCIHHPSSSALEGVEEAIRATPTRTTGRHLAARRGGDQAHCIWIHSFG